MKNKMMKDKPWTVGQEAASQDVPEGYLTLAQAWQELREQVKARPDCPDEQTLCGYADGTLWRKHRAIAEDLKKHLKDCPVCRYDVRQITSYLPLTTRIGVAGRRDWLYNIVTAGQALWSAGCAPWQWLARRWALRPSLERAAQSSASTEVCPPGGTSKRGLVRSPKPVSVLAGAVVVVLLPISWHLGRDYQAPVSWQQGRDYEAQQWARKLQLGAEKQAEPGPDKPSLSGLSAEDLLAWLVAPNPKQPGDVASSVKVLERYLQSYPEDAAICVKLLHLYTVQRAQVKDEAQRQALAKKIAAKRQILAVLLPELGLEGDHNEGKPL